MGRYDRIIFVSTYGTCRSILAKAIFDNIKSQHDVMSQYDIMAESRGLVVLFEEPVNPKAEVIAKSKGLDIEGATSKQLTDEDFGESTIVLVMTEQLKKKLYNQFENAVNVYTLREFSKGAIDIETIKAGELADYGNMYERIEEMISLAVERIVNMEEQNDSDR